MMEDNKNIKMLKRQTMEKKNEHRSWSSNVKRKLDSRRNHTIERNLKEQHKKKRSSEGIRKERWLSMGIKWSGSYGRKNLYSKQPEDSRTNPIEKL